MSNGATSQNELVASSDDPAAGGSSSSPAPMQAPTPEVFDVEAGTKGVPVTFPSRVSTTAHGGRVRVAEQQQQQQQQQQRWRFDIAGDNPPVFGSRNQVSSRRPLALLSSTHTRPVNST